jgi:hypothetical protein
VRVGSLSLWRGPDLTLAPATLSTFLYLLDSSCSLRNPFCIDFVLDRSCCGVVHFFWWVLA